MAAVMAPAAPLGPAAGGAGAVPATSFNGYSKVPPEIRALILKLAVVEEAGNIIEVCIDRKPTLRRVGPGRSWSMNWAYRCHERNPSVIAHVNQEARGEYFRLRPNTLQLNRQPPIHFNAAQDTIFIDCESMFNLFDYVLWWRNVRAVPLANLSGFNTIRTLGHYNNALPPAERIDNNGLMILMLPAENVFTGLANIRLLGPRGAHPGPRPGGIDPATLPVIQRPLNLRLMTAVTNKITASNGGRSARRPLTVGQQNVFNNTLSFVTHEVFAFFAPNASNIPFVIPVTVG
ncbi:hypothetical protein N431DRAFT_451646 [Stipitochalara longipes BDJ]|nr:hypothetical protein N431DRAFT_451646 [Stipitochalara longipes BDJ]